MFLKNQKASQAQTKLMKENSYCKYAYILQLNRRVEPFNLISAEYEMKA